jgi:hypothetical protein
VTRAGDGASADDTNGAREDDSNTFGEAWFCRSDPPIAQECRTTVIGAISLWSACRKALETIGWPALPRLCAPAEHEFTCDSYGRLDVLVEVEKVRRIESVLQGDETATRRQNSTVRHHRAASLPAALPFDNLDCALPERRDPKTQTVIGYHFTARLPRRGLRLMCGLDVRAQ